MKRLRLVLFALLAALALPAFAADAAAAESAGRDLHASDIDPMFYRLDAALAAMDADIHAKFGA